MPEPLFKDLDKLPRHQDIFLWADYVELLCLCSANGFVSRSNLQAQAQEAEDIQAEYDEDNNDDWHQPAFPLNDKLSQRWDDIHSRLKVRQQSYPGWPFTLEANLLRSNFDSTNSVHRLYVALLIASTLRLCHKKRSNEVTAAFEEISYHWLRFSLTSLWEVRVFGAHQTLPEAYNGTLYEKYQALARDLSGKLLKDKDDFDPRNTGDGGIDLVAWQHMGDHRGHNLVILGQCACSPDDWESKQLDVSPAAIGDAIHIAHPNAAICFVPHDLSASEQSWQRPDKVKRIVLVDRVRLLYLFKTLQVWDQLPNLNNWTFIDEPIGMQATLAA
jgi:hypothetical protein